jgi:uncharacterized protein
LELRFRTSVLRLRVGLGLLALIFSFTAHAGAQTKPQSPVPLPVPFNPIVDNANVIDADTRRRLESIFLNLKERAQIEYAVLTVPTTNGQDIFDFSLAVARGWGIGAKDGDRAGLLLVVAIQDRKYFTQVSDHLEGDLPDGLLGQIQRERLVPAFRQGNYSKGIFDTIQSYVATLGAKRSFNIEGIDQRYAYRADEQQPASGTRRRNISFSTICCGIIVIVFVLILLSIAGSRGGGGGRGGRRRRGGWGGGSGLWQALFWGSVLGNLSGGGRSSSGWGGGGGFGGSSWGGGGGGGFGGGFGGGGSFGGGGAGGSW